LPSTPNSVETDQAIRSAQAQLLTERIADQRSQLAVASQQIEKLRSATNVDEVIGMAPLRISTLGYERVLLSWVEDEKWVPTSAYTLSGPDEASAIVAAGGPPYMPVRSLLEVNVVRKRTPILGLDADTNPRVHPGIYPVTRSVTYVAVPIVMNGRVAAIIHVDRNAESGLNDEYDRDVLALFAQNVGLALERLQGSNRQPLPPAAEEKWHKTLTRREKEVLVLIASGLTNAEIGGKLYISEGTVKTHAKTLMRKLGVTNRAQAGALYHRLYQGLGDG